MKASSPSFPFIYNQFKFVVICFLFFFFPFWIVFVIVVSVVSGSELK